MKNLRALNQKEIATLAVYGSTADNWDNIRVVENFSPEYVANVHFSGNIELGSFNKVFELAGGFKKHSGIYNCKLHNCIIGDDVYIDNIHNYIANYKIGNSSYIENTNIILVDKETNFGNGHQVTVMNETGGREIPIYNELSAPTAYVLAFYRHRPQLIENIKNQIGTYATSRTSTMGYIGDNVSIVNCGRIKNVWIEDYSKLKGCSSLKNGTISSNKEAPTLLGSGVKCSNFIISSGSQILDSTLLTNCFVGQGCVMDKHYSANESVFFANCQGMHGEASSVFAGPFTVSHHKSTLLIAGLYSFLNAGSGSNQSNHMYKLGPIHQGVVERGSKTTSDSYLLWPAKIGAFTLVMGRHTAHSDTTNLPFSYLIEIATESLLVPGVNLSSVGTVRDAQKWPKRDNRRDLIKIDPVNYNLLSPYTIQKMFKGVEVLEGLKEMSGENSQFYSYQNCKIKNSSLNKGIEYYRMGICKFLGNTLISKIEKEQPKTFKELINILSAKKSDGVGEWIDLSGLIAPKSEVNKILDKIENGKLSLAEVDKKWWELHYNYYDLEWEWSRLKLLEMLKKDLSEVTKEDIINIILEWKQAVVQLDNMLYKDARKEFDLAFMTGFGIDGNNEEKQKDFENVRGMFDENPFVVEVLKHIEVKSQLGDRTIEYINNLV